LNDDGEIDGQVVAALEARELIKVRLHAPEDKKALAGELAADAGDCEIQPGTRLARVEQEAPALERPVLDYLLDADAELRAAESEIVSAEARGDGEAIAHAHERHERAGGYTARARAQTLLAGLGFAPGDAARAVREFSGGFRMRLNLARALIEHPGLVADLDCAELAALIPAGAAKEILDALFARAGRFDFEALCEGLSAPAAALARKLAASPDELDVERARKIVEDMPSWLRKRQRRTRSAQFKQRLRAAGSDWQSVLGEHDAGHETEARAARTGNPN